MNRRLVVVSLAALALSILASAAMQLYVPTGMWLYVNRAAGIGWLVNIIVSTYAGSQLLFWALLVAGIAGLGRK